jgi:hypothetical protein
MGVAEEELRERSIASSRTSCDELKPLNFTGGRRGSREGKLSFECFFCSLCELLSHGLGLVSGQMWFDKHWLRFRPLARSRYVMTRRAITSSFRSGLKILGLILSATAPAIACFKGQRFDPPKPFSLPELPAIISRNVKLDGPTFDPLRLDGLLGPRVASVEMPAPPRLAGAVAPELHAVFVSYVRKFEAERASRAGVPERIDRAMALVEVGKHADAIIRLLALEAEFPGLDKMAASLGMAYELAGNLEEAVIWIARRMERDADSPDGTEWLHLAILRAKLRMREDNGWLKDHSVLDDISDADPKEILRVIDGHLAERLRFVRPADAIVCDLFYQAARRVNGPNAAVRRLHYLRESLRFGEWRKAEIAALQKP